ncbi:universal stress protein [Haloglomus irregulare]|jgi:nucleotide-binding universal stress UspA family protein|uniref:Universal stress protein n=1 Tax=Haloglomus irregulare TaxID=2234134 RepID=A0A554N9E6_9EURY|nr:universal stress protein [Haloglomus irregulare]TSD13975.1 universal stress protein [Haloglomus irregulare]
MYDTLLLPTDGSDATRSAIRHANELATTYDATVHILSVVDTRNRFESPSGGLAPDAWAERERERAKEAIDEAAAALSGAIAVERAIQEGTPTEGILGYIDDAGIDMVVVATHGRTGLDRYLIGSVTEEVVRKSPVPVLTASVED